MALKRRLSAGMKKLSESPAQSTHEGNYQDMLHVSTLETCNSLGMSPTLLFGKLSVYYYYIISTINRRLIPYIFMRS